MRKPVSGNTWFRTCCSQFISFAEHWFIKNFVRPIVFVLPPSLITAALSNRSSIRTQFESYFGHQLGSEIGQFLDQSALLIIVGTFIYLALLKTAYSFIEQHAKPERELSRDDLDTILETLNIVVGDKAKRFYVAAKQQLNQSAPITDKLFQNLTKPEQQIGLLTSALRGAFQVIDQTDASFRVGLLIIQSGKPVDWAHFSPAEQPPRTAAQELQHNSSTVMHAIRDRAMVIVEDIEKEIKIKKQEKRRYIKGNSRENMQGSQLCYPITHPATNKIEYVVSIAGDKKACLLERHAPLYEWIVKHYALRITLEHSLLILKQKADETSTH